MQKRLYAKAVLANENMIMFGIFFFIFIAIAYYALSTLSGGYTGNQITGALIAIKNTADDVHSLGVGNRETIRIDLPKNLKNTTITGNAVVFHTNDGDAYDENFDYQIIGSLPATEGSYQVPITAVNEKTVKIGDAPYIQYMVPNCMGKRKFIWSDMVGADFINVSLYLMEPVSHGGLTIPYFPTNYTILGPTLAKVFVDINQTHPSGNYILFYAHPKNDPYYFYWDQPSTGKQSNFVSFHINTNCTLVN